ncbi:uncharacterized protein DUF3144 [Azomonas agilis]|uniref:Uncharacterized protein DUF3144 n=1 Tax=Azomonas agilis TaxID=116849 RepID=A0A562I0R1_9GAMM|nr:DUF3144 domain-containing protein [Azomonas agilis]TWH64416.1 uncharacterized protein DUF3144 [Azomonas agilis]
MSDDQDNMVIFNMADEFIEVANRLMKEENKELAHVSTALRYAAARFSTHEAACTFKELATEREHLQTWYSNQFNAMLEENFFEQIDLLSQNFIVEMSDK